MSEHPVHAKESSAVRKPRRHGVLPALLASLVAGLALATCAFLLMFGITGDLYGEGGIFILLTCGATAGLSAGLWLSLEHRLIAWRIHPIISGLITYYGGVLAFWACLLAIVADARVVPQYWEWIAEESATSVLAFATTTPFGVVTLALCFLLRAWVVRFLRPPSAD